MLDLDRVEHRRFARVVEFGRHKRLKISRSSGRAGSSPASGTIIWKSLNAIRTMNAEPAPSGVGKIVLGQVTHAGITRS